MVLCYIFNTLNGNKNSFCYHKIEKWFAYITSNLIIIENFSIEKNRPQQILNDSQFDLKTIKISQNNKILYSTSTSKIKNPYILFYSYNYNYNTKFTLINKCIFNNVQITDCEISPKNNLCIVLNKNNSCSFVSILDFYNNEILITTTMNQIYHTIKWNIYLQNLEFTTIGEKSITFWRINSTDGSLQYQEGNFDFEKYPLLNILSIEFLPPIYQINTIIMLIGCSQGKILAFDTRTNNCLFIFDNILFDYNINFIFCNESYVTFIGNNYFKYYYVDFKKDNDIKNFFSSHPDKYNKMSFDSEIISFDFDIRNDNDALIMTKKGLVHYINYKEKSTVKLFHFINTQSTVLQVKIMKKSYDKYLIKENPFDYNFKEDNKNDDIEENEKRENLLNLRENYYLISSHSDGSIKIWTIPEYILLYNFETINEQILYFDVAINDLLFAVSYTDNTIRFFNNEKLLGKFFSQHLTSYSPFKYIKFFPESKYLYLIDTSNIMFLILVERYEPLLIQYHKIMSIDYDIVDFNISSVECYNKFYFNIQNVYLYVYNRKFTNIMQNLSFENSIPQFYVQDKFSMVDYFKQKGVKNNRNPIEKFTISFSTNVTEKSFIYLMSQGNKELIIRNYETHVIENIIDFNDKICTFNLTPNFKNIIFLFENKIKIGNIVKIFNRKNYDGLDQYDNYNNIFAEDLCDMEEKLIYLSNQFKMVISDNSNILVLYSNTNIFVYKIKEL